MGGELSKQNELEGISWQCQVTMWEDKKKLLRLNVATLSS